jgi:two-component system NtrC family sensor kinase
VGGGEPPPSHVQQRRIRGPAREASESAGGAGPGAAAAPLAAASNSAEGAGPGAAAAPLAAASNSAEGAGGGFRGERAFLERPSIGIRARLVLSFLSFVLFAVAVTIGSWILISRLEGRLRFLEAADRYTMEIQQTRRFEKNYFLYGTNLEDVRDHLDGARRLLEAAEPDAAKVVTPADLSRMHAHLDRYQSLIARLRAMQGASAPGSPTERAAIENELRDHGSQMVAFALELAEKERASVNGTLALFKRLPIAFLAFLLLFSVFVANYLARQMVGPLGRLMETTQRIARGDFTPVKPRRWYRDEFSNFAVALNTMMRELERRQEVLVNSHKLSAIGRLTAGVAHELNNPVNNITLTAEMLKEDYPTLSDAERLDMVNDLVEQAGRAQRIVRNLLDFARESEITTERLDVADVLRDATRLAANPIRLAGAKITLDLAENLPPVHGDKQSLSQVFVNLLLNALDSVRKGGRVRISAASEHDRGWVEITVTDDGCGIPAHVLPHVFDPFFTTKPRGKGTGLGLSVSLGIVRQHGGDIRVDSAPGKGTTVTVLLPAALVPGLPNRAPAPTAAKTSPRA